MYKTRLVLIIIMQLMRN